jgi:hypothetical protein
MERIQAFHPHWTGFLQITASGEVEREGGSGRKGRYHRTGAGVTITWKDFEPDEFVFVGSSPVHVKLLETLPDLAKLSGVRAFGKVLKARLRTHYRSQNVNVAAMQMAEKKVWAHLS